MSSAAQPGACGIGLRAPHYQDFLQSKPTLDFVELHSENFFGAAGEIQGAPRRLLEQVRADYALSLHGVGLSLGSAEPVRRAHLQQLKWLEQRFAPQWISDHLAWVGIGGRYANDLLPLPYTDEALAIVRDNVLATQDFLGRRILVENPSCYLSFAHSSIPEWEFMNALAHSAGCGILLDINNIYVSAMNLGFDPHEYLAAIDPARVEEIHLAGFTRTPERLIDTHSAPVDAAVWELYEFALQRCGAIPTMVEWDAELPVLDVLLDEARRASTLLARVEGGKHAGVA
jgi:uncharacterized protein (UPF0276 family)